MYICEVRFGNFVNYIYQRTPLIPPPQKKMGEEEGGFTCRFCLEHEVDRMLVMAPCLCKGSSKWVHVTCLDKWRDEKPGTSRWKCKSCDFTYKLRAEVVIWVKVVDAFHYLVDAMYHICFGLIWLYIFVWACTYAYEVAGPSIAAMRPFTKPREMMLRWADIFVNSAIAFSAFSTLYFAYGKYITIIQPKLERSRFEWTNVPVEDIDEDEASWSKAGVATS